MAEILRCDSCGATSPPHLAPWWARINAVAGDSTGGGYLHACSVPCLQRLALRMPHLASEEINGPEPDDA